MGYRTHGLLVQSEIALPHAAADDAATQPDVEIRVGSYPVTGDSIRNCSWIRGTPGALQFDVAGVGTFSCIGGRQIWFHPEPNASPTKVELFTLGTALGIIHYQRGDFPIHGAFVAAEERA